MALKSITGDAHEEDDSVEGCHSEPASKWWNIRVRVKHQEGKPPLASKLVRVEVDDATHDITTSASGFFCLEFDPGDDLTQVVVTVTHWPRQDELWSGRPSAPYESGESIYLSTAHINGFWTLEVNVYDRLPADMRGAHRAVPLPRAPIKISWGGQERAVRTGTAGETFVHARMDCTTAYLIEADFKGCLAELSGYQVAGDEFQREESTKIVQLKINEPMETVTVNFYLAFSQLFVVGEGEHFAYAIPLAKRYSGTRGDDRKWIVASQYDVDAPSEEVGNLFIYRDATDRRFDVTSADHWRRARARYGRFEAVLFNNPHPGYAVHMCEVFGVTDQEPHASRSARYISVHSIGYEGRVTRDDATARFTTANQTVFPPVPQVAPVVDNDDARVQKEFLRLTGCDRTGDDTLGDYQPGGRQARAITALFAPLAEADLTFANRASHYGVIATTIGLKAFLLRKYAVLGLDVLIDGGELWVNGSKEFEAHIENGDLPGFEKVGRWRDNDDYYVEYEGNFTSTEFHPSYFAKPSFRPVEPPVSTAFCYRKVKE